MSLWNRLFRKDPVQRMKLAEEHLDAGRFVEARQLGRELARSGPPSMRPRAREIEEAAREGLVASQLAEADRMEADDLFEDGAEWVRAALEHVEEEPRRGELQERLRRLEGRAEAGGWSPELDDGPLGDEEPEGLPTAPFGFDLESHYQTLIGTLREDLAEVYAGREPAFQRAYVDVNEGRAKEALGALGRLLAASPEDPVLRLERGRARLLSGDAQGAREDLEIAWEGLGVEPLDQSGALSIPGLWAEACLALESPGEVVERLREAASLETSTPEVSLLYAQALAASGALAETRDYLRGAAETFPRVPDLPHELALVLAELGERDEAREVLEALIAPACAGGSCSGPGLYPPALHTLARLYLEDGVQVGRAVEVLDFLSYAQGGYTREDLLLVARAKELSGDPEAAQRVLRKAREMPGP